MKKLIHFGVLALTLASLANASTVIINPDGAGAPLVVFGMTGFATSGADMAAEGTLQIKITFSDNSSATVSWGTNVGACTSVAGCGIASGAVPGGGVWTLTETGDTGFVGDPSSPDTTALRAWTLTNTSTATAITSVQLIGGSRITFDRDSPTGSPLAPSGGQVGTPSSAFGIDYHFASESGANSPFGVSVTYDNILQFFSNQACQGAAFPGNTLTGCHDEWNTLTFTFTTGTFQATGAGSAVWAFFQDTDTVGVPEPATFGLIGAGLVLAAVAYRKRRLSR